MVIAGCSHKLETNVCNITKGKKLEVIHITLEPGIYEIVNSKIPKNLIGYLPIDMKLPDRGAVAVSVALPNGGWEFVPSEEKNGIDNEKHITFELHHDGGGSTTAFNHLIQVFAISENCDFNKLRINQIIKPPQFKAS